METPAQPRPAVLLTSGGVDSVTTAYFVKYRLKAPKMILVFADYKQRTHDYEKFCIEAIGKELGAPVKLIDLRWLGDLSTSVLTKPGTPIAETKEEDLWNAKKAEERILKWWDVVRNLELVTVGLAHAESMDLGRYLSMGEREIWDVYIGIRRETPVAMKDNTPEFLRAHGQGGPAIHALRWLPCDGPAHNLRQGHGGEAGCRARRPMGVHLQLLLGERVHRSRRQEASTPLRQMFKLQTEEVGLRSGGSG